MVEHGMLHFGWLDTMASDLDLLVHSAKELDLAVCRPVTSTVACPVCPHELAIDGDLDEAVTVQGRIGISSSKPVSCDNKLSHHP
jgi:hypothetical protein